jgi:hypothetical protein
MPSIFPLTVTVAAIALSAPAIAADEKIESKVKIEKEADGDYKETSKTTHKDSDGTTTMTRTRIDVDVEDDGSRETTVETRKVTDPKGLLNRETAKTVDRETVKADGTVESSHTKTVNGKTVEDTRPTAGTRVGDGL